VYVDLRCAGEYAALSYTWGSADHSIPILVNNRVSLITENLYLALLHLRQRNVTMLWVDALCINQDDLAERGRQVAQMKDVYCRAAMVHIWLGESDEFTERVFDELHSLSDHLDYDGRSRSGSSINVRWISISKDGEPSARYSIDHGSVACGLSRKHYLLGEL
jgi:hypothetical protein